jgi:TonB family protein
MLSRIYSFSQNDTTVFYIDYYGKKTNKEKAEFLRKQFLQDGKWTVNDYYLNGVLQMTGIYKNNRFKKKNGLFIYYSDNGKVSSYINYQNNIKNGLYKDFNKDGVLQTEGFYKKGKNEGLWKWYYTNGQACSEEIYRDGVLISYTFYNENGEKTKEGIITSESKNVIGEEPEFVGGLDSLYAYLSKETIYPIEAKNNNIQGKVKVQFFVGKDGTIEDVKIIQSVHRLLDEEALRVVSSMPNWKPGRFHNLPIRYRYVLPINFNFN